MIEEYCERCDSKISNSFYAKNLNGEDIEICEFCYYTMLGTILKYSKQYTSDTRELAKGICQSLNLIVEKIGSSGK